MEQDLAAIVIGIIGLLLGGTALGMGIANLMYALREISEYRKHGGDNSGEAKDNR